MTEKVVPILVKPVPALNVPGPTIKENVRLLVPTMSLPIILEQKNPDFVLEVPYSTNTNAPATPIPTAKSAARTGAPDTATI